MPPNFAEMRHVLNIAQARPPMLYWALLATSACKFCDAQLHAQLSCMGLVLQQHAEPRMGTPILLSCTIDPGWHAAPRALIGYFLLCRCTRQPRS